MFSFKADFRRRFNDGPYFFRDNLFITLKISELDNINYKFSFYSLVEDGENLVDI